MSTGSNFVIDITIRNDNITTTSHPFVRTKYGMLIKFDTKYINAPMVADTCNTIKYDTTIRKDPITLPVVSNFMLQDPIVVQMIQSILPVQW